MLIVDGIVGISSAAEFLGTNDTSDDTVAKLGDRLVSC
jgi:hypothetical protein